MTQPKPTPDESAPLDRLEQERAAGEGMIARPVPPSGEAAATADPTSSDGIRPDADEVEATSDTEHATLSHERTSEPDMHRIQGGWQVHDRSGSRLGDVVERDDESFVVALAARAGAGVRLPMRLIAEEDFDERRARLTIGTDELDRMRPPGEEERPAEGS